MIIDELKLGNTKVYIHNDYIPTDDKSQSLNEEAIKNVATDILKKKRSKKRLQK